MIPAYSLCCRCCRRFRITWGPRPFLDYCPSCARQIVIARALTRQCFWWGFVGGVLTASLVILLAGCASPTSDRPSQTAHPASSVAQGETVSSNAHNVASAGSTPAPATNFVRRLVTLPPMPTNSRGGTVPVLVYTESVVGSTPAPATNWIVLPILATKTNAVFQLQASTDLVHWRLLHTWSNGASAGRFPYVFLRTNGTEFYRIFYP
jgi:hypothetical protein